MRRRRWLLLATIPLLLIIAHTLYWRSAEQQLRAGYDAWVATQRQAGWQISAGEPGIAGWPVAAGLDIGGFTATGSLENYGAALTWSADKLALRVRLLQPRRLEIMAEGQQKIRFANSPEVPYTADSVRAMVPLEPDEPPHSVNFAAVNLRAGVPAPGGATGPLTAGRVEATLQEHPAAAQGEPAMTLALDAQAITLPPEYRWPLGRQIESLACTAALNGPLPHARNVTEGATAWRDDGGSLEVENAQLVWGPLKLTGSATLALDPQLQPMGAGVAHIRGYAETLDALASAGQISHSAAIAAKAVLSLLADATDDGGSEVEVPLALQYRTLSMRQIPLTRFPELDWPQP